MKTISRYVIEIVIKPGMASKPIGEYYDFERVEVLGENASMLCLNDDDFTRVYKGKSEINVCLNKPAIRCSMNHDTWGTSVKYVLYMETGRKRKATIAREIREELEYRYGGFCGINLNFLEGEANSDADN